MALWSRRTKLFETIDRRWFEIYFGADWPLFSPALDRILARKRLSFGQLFWPGALFPVPALLYRRLWVYGLGLLVAIVVAGLLRFHPGAAVGMTAGMGLTLRSVAFDPAAKRIHAILSRSRVASDAAVEIATAGRPSMPAAVIGAFLYAGALYVAILGMIDRPLLHPATISILVALLVTAALGSAIAWVKIRNPRYASPIVPAPAAKASGAVANAAVFQPAPAPSPPPSLRAWWAARWTGYSRTALSLLIFAGAVIAFNSGLAAPWERDAIVADRINQVMSLTFVLAVFALIPSLVVQLIGGRFRITFAVAGFVLLALSGAYPRMIEDILSPAAPLGIAAFAVALLLLIGASVLVLAPSGPGWFAEAPQPWPWRWRGFLRTLLYLFGATVLFNLVAIAANRPPPPPSLWAVVEHLRFRLLYSLGPALVVGIVVQTLFGRNRVSLGAGGVTAAWLAFWLYSFYESFERGLTGIAN